MYSAPEGKKRSDRCQTCFQALFLSIAGQSSSGRSAQIANSLIGDVRPFRSLFGVCPQFQMDCDSGTGQSTWLLYFLFSQLLLRRVFVACVLLVGLPKDAILQRM